MDLVLLGSALQVVGVLLTGTTEWFDALRWSGRLALRLVDAVYGWFAAGATYRRRPKSAQLKLAGSGRVAFRGTRLTAVARPGEQKPTAQKVEWLIDQFADMQTAIQGMEAAITDEPWSDPIEELERRVSARLEELESRHESTTERRLRRGIGFRIAGTLTLLAGTGLVTIGAWSVA